MLKEYVSSAAKEKIAKRKFLKGELAVDTQDKSKWRRKIKAYSGYVS